ncbi:PEP-utilizing enzyme [Nanoarchaeota archaeon]
MKWIKIWSREYGVMYSEAVVRTLTYEATHLIPLTIENVAIIPESNNEAVCFAEDEWDKLAQALQESSAGSLKKFKAFCENFHLYGKSYVDVAEKLSAQELNSLTMEELEEGFNEYVIAYFDYTTLLWDGLINNRVFAELANEMIERQAKKIGKQEMLTEFKTAIFEPREKAGIKILQEKVSEFKQGNNDLQELWEEFQWISCLDIHDSPWKIEDMQKYVDDFEMDKKEILDYDRVIEELEFTAEEKEKLEIAKGLVYIKDVRDDYRRKGVFYIQHFLSEIASRKGISLRDISYLLTKEVFEDIPEDLEERKKGFLLYYDDGKLICISDKAEIQELKETKFKSLYEADAGEEIKGLVGFPGKVQGKAKVITSVKDLDKVEKGDILVAITTHPDFVPAMHRAAAFVTDEGGITSHAAIVSRELKKPCIVGTKIATSRIKDNDVIEVNANNGVVRKL